MADNNPPSFKKRNNGGHKQQKRKIDPGDKFDWRKATRTITFWILLVIGSWIVFRQLSLNEHAETKKSYSQYLKLLESGQIGSAEIVEHEFHGVLNDGSSIVTVLPFIDSDMLAQWDSLRIDYQFREKTTSWFGYLITSILPWIIIIAIWLYIMRRMQGGGQKGLFSFGKSRAKLMMESAPKVTFADVAGVDEAKEELQEIIAFLRDPKKFSRLGGHIPKGGLLLGPPGTGKTLLARAVAGEAEVPFFSMSGADFVEMFVGVGAARVRDLFEQGKKSAPCIIFIDEIDAVGRHRGAGLGGGHDEREQTLNQLLVEMDGFESNEGVILIAATNRPDVLDPALTRPGRFDRQIVVDRPDVRGREGILKVHTREIPIARDVKLKDLAKGTPGLAGADLANMVNEAALLAARRGAKRVGMSDFEEAKDKIMMGAERKSILISEDEKKQTAYHEAGHVLVSKLTPGADPVHKVTIIPRGRALGITHFLPLDEKHNYSRSYLTQSLNHLLGGRTAEKLVFNELSTGAGNDIERATQIARKMVCEWGMSDRLGPVTYGRKQEEIFLGRDFVQQRDYSEKTAQEIDQEVRTIVKEAERRAEEMLSKNMDKLKALAESLLEREILDGAEIDHIIRGEKLPPIHARDRNQRARHRPPRSRKTPRKETVRSEQPGTVRSEQPRKVRSEQPRKVRSEQPRKEIERKDKDDSTSSSRSGKSRRQFARSYGIASSRDPRNMRPSPVERTRIDSSKDEPEAKERQKKEPEKQERKQAVKTSDDSAKGEGGDVQAKSIRRTSRSRRKPSVRSGGGERLDSRQQGEKAGLSHESSGQRKHDSTPASAETSVGWKEADKDKSPSGTIDSRSSKGKERAAAGKTEQPAGKTGAEQPKPEGETLPRYNGAGFDTFWGRQLKIDDSPKPTADDAGRRDGAPKNDRPVDRHDDSASAGRDNNTDSTGSDGD